MIQVAENCSFGCKSEHRDQCPDPCESKCARKVLVPLFDLPLGFTEGRAVGSLDLKKALAQGQKHYEPGLPAKSHRGFVYIEEINQLGSFR